MDKFYSLKGEVVFVGKGSSEVSEYKLIYQEGKFGALRVEVALPGRDVLTCGGEVVVMGGEVHAGRSSLWKGSSCREKFFLEGKLLLYWERKFMQREKFC